MDRKCEEKETRNSHLINIYWKHPGNTLPSWTCIFTPYIPELVRRNDRLEDFKIPNTTSVIFNANFICFLGI